MRGSIAAVRAPPVVDLAPTGLWCRVATLTQGFAALRPGLNYLSPYGLQSAHARRKGQRRDGLTVDNRPLLGAFLIPPALPVVLIDGECIREVSN